MLRFDPSATLRRVTGTTTEQTASTSGPKTTGDGYETSTRPSLAQRAWSFLGRLWNQAKLVLSGFASLLGAERGSSMPTENKPAAAAQLGVIRGKNVSKGALLYEQVKDAEAKYADARRVATTSVAWAEREGVAKPILDQALSDIASADGKAEAIFQNLANLHRSGTSRRNQREKLDGLVSALQAIAGRLDSASSSARAA